MTVEYWMDGDDLTFTFKPEGDAEITLLGVLADRAGIKAEFGEREDENKVTLTLSGL